jgi:hypothetical protein
MRDLQQLGLTLRGMAAELNKRKVKTPRGGKWHPETVARLIDRLR